MIDTRPRAHARFKKFLSYYRPYLGLFLADMACAFILSAVTLLLPQGARVITQQVLPEGGPDALGQILAVGALMLVLVAIHALCSFFVDYQGHMMGARMERDMRQELFDHYQKLSFSFYNEHQTGQLMSRLTHDLLWLSELYHHGPEDLALGLLTLIGVFVALVTINVELTLIVFLFLPVMLVYALVFNRRMNAAIRRSHERIGDINAQVEDTLAGIRVVQSFANEDLESQKFARENRRFLESRRDDYKNSGYFSGGMIAFTQLITLAVIVLGGIGILQASLDLAELLTYLLYVGVLIEPVQRLVNFARLYQVGITGFNRFMEFLEVAPDIQDAPDAVDVERVRGDVEFRDVSFKYKDGRQDVIKRVSLTIAAGEYVALVGTSGVGKTTLCSLIPRFFEVSDGAIHLDGRDIRSIRLRALRQQIGVVQQDVYLFAGTVAENIRYGRPDATPAEIVEAAKQANAHDFILALPDGYDTDIGQRGVKLSGGQKQRLSIARVFLKDPPILIFDEATSALDNESENAVRESLERLAARRTTLVIAHRLSTIRNAGRIVVLTDSGIVEQGRHDELLGLNGAYAQLYGARS